MDIDYDDPNYVRVDLDLTLRTRQAQYVEYLSQRDADTFSHALGRIIERAIQQLVVDGPGRTEKIRKHVTLPVTSLVFVDQLCATWGLPRSDVVRRLIDDALARDPTV